MANHRSLEHTIRESRMRLTMQNSVTEIELDEVIMNSNSCGQGHDPEHSNHPFHATILKHGYSYSHSTPVVQKDGSTVSYHTYKHHANRDKNVSVVKPPGMDQHRWDTSTSGQGRKAVQGWHSGTLDRHLKTRKVKPLINHTDLKTEEVTVEVIAEAVVDEGNAFNRTKKKEYEVKKGKELLNSKPEPHAKSNTKAKQILRMTNKKEEVEPEAAEIIETLTDEEKIHYERLGHMRLRNPKLLKPGENEYFKKLHQKLIASEKKEEVETPVETEIVELAPAAAAPDPMKQKMDAQRAQVQKQKDQLRMQIAQQKAAKQEQAMKTKGEASVAKIKESQEQLDERERMRIRTFDRASKLQKLHAMQYNRMSASGNLAQAELHRKRAAEYKRIMYTARDNPDKLPSV